MVTISDSISQCEKMKNLLSPKKISSNQLFSNFFSKTNTFTKFLRTDFDKGYLIIMNIIKRKAFTHESFYSTFRFRYNKSNDDSSLPP